MTRLLPEQLHCARYEKEDRKQNHHDLVWVLRVLCLKFIVSLREKDDGNCKDHNDVWSVE